jgi:hypothetical protein
MRMGWHGAHAASHRLHEKRTRKFKHVTRNMGLRGRLTRVWQWNITLGLKCFVQVCTVFTKRKTQYSSGLLWTLQWTCMFQSFVNNWAADCSSRWTLLHAINYDAERQVACCEKGSILLGFKMGRFSSLGAEASHLLRSWSVPSP